jgi:hypothetical protein
MIILMLFIASYFDFVGTMVRKMYKMLNSANNRTLENRIRSFQIIASALLCYYTIRIDIYKHQKFSLIIIIISLIIIIIIEIIDSKNDGIERYISLLLALFSGFGRAFMDTIEKYLLEFNYLNPYVITGTEGITCSIFIIIPIILNRQTFLTEINKIISVEYKGLLLL